MNKSYVINGTTYTQSPLVIGQVARLLPALQGVVLPSLAPIALLSALQDRIPAILACVLVPEGETPSDALIDLLQEEFTSWTMPAATVLEVICDFLDCNPLSIFDRFNQVVATLRPAEMMPLPTTTATATGPDPSAPCSAAATLSGAAPSAGE